jgi:CO dehydrogenase nickel-insertion accessory protein CooC1
MALTLEMAKDHWQKLSDFIESSNQVRALINKVHEAGKQQVTLQADEIKVFLAVEVPPEVWIKLGALLGEKLKEDDDE